MDTIEDLPTEEGLFPIRTVCAATGIHPVTLRAWERRYGLIRPKRTPKGHRLYSAEDIDLIKRVLRLLDQGVSIGQVGQLLELQEADEAPAAETPGESNTWGGYRMRLREAISGLDIQVVTTLWEDALSLFSLDNCLTQLALPVQRSLAERPSSDQQARAELGFYSRWLRQTLETRLRQCRPGKDAPWVAAAPVHESPLNMDLLRFALAAAQRGLAVRLFTTSTPIAGL
ncbi:MAG TPA: MerR family transcriptional regulator, partial [Thioalkalivibrio sp.]|nr:MerR family transcriptional regulator [Thioalkalivibrio sp.]